MCSNRKEVITLEETQATSAPSQTDMVKRLQDLYALRDKTKSQIEAVEKVLGGDTSAEPKRRTRGPNKPKASQPETLPTNEL